MVKAFYLTITTFLEGVFLWLNKYRTRKTDGFKKPLPLVKKLFSMINKIGWQQPAYFV
jgi:hypothetical protein